MRMRLSEVRRLVREADQADHGWIYDACIKFVYACKDHGAHAGHITLWLERNGLAHRDAAYITSIIYDTGRLDDLLDVNTVRGNELLAACADEADENERRWPKAHIIVGRHQHYNGSFHWEEVELELDFMDMVVSDREGEPIWQYDPETLELLRVPEYMAMVDPEGDECFARLRDIESGNV